MAQLPLSEQHEAGMALFFADARLLSRRGKSRRSPFSPPHDLTPPLVPRQIPFSRPTLTAGGCHDGRLCPVFGGPHR
jgi:hypothetical protein